MTNILGNSGIEPANDGTWPRASYLVTAREDEPVRLPTGQEMHKVQTRIHELGLNIAHITEQEPIDTKTVEALKAERSAYRAKNRELKEELHKKKASRPRNRISQGWSLGG
ncbi:MAG: hypothetical protein QG623_13 [Patescibacteria group bacterium]|nr:hypothetical protein [Patescibacteria group bacterium]